MRPSGHLNLQPWRFARRLRRYPERMEIRNGAVGVLAVTLCVITLGAERDPSTLPRLAESSLQYLGAFKVPNSGNPTTIGDAGWVSFGGGPLAFNPANNSLFIGNRAHFVAEISIPAAVKTAVTQDMNRATWLQGFRDPTEGHWDDAIGGNGFGAGGLLVDGGKLYGTGYIYYDAAGTQQKSHFARSTNLSTPSFSGFSQLTSAPQAGFVAGWMTHVPAEWQSALGAKVLTGLCCVPIVSRTSYGPAAFGFDPSKLGQPTVPVVPLLYYPGDHTTLGPWDGSNPTYGATTQMAGMAFIAETRSVLYIGRNGLGPHCYGDGTGDKAHAEASGGKLCYDPTTSSKGSHAYPYRYQVWAYDANDLAAVKAGKRRPWDVKPYAVIPITLPGGSADVVFGGVAYDAPKQLLYVSQLLAEGAASGYLPLIHVFKVNVPGPAPDRAP